MLQGDDRDTIDSVQVALRIRPLMQHEIESGCDECIEVVSGQPQVQIKGLAFTYNYVFPQHITQQECYDTTVKGLIEKLFQGYNVTILAYGQTGSGKTYTMGTNYSGSDGESSQLGIIPHSVTDIFHFMEANEDKFEFKVNVSFLELYQEQCFDLLSRKKRSHSIIEIREDINRELVLSGLTELPVSSIMETMIALERGSLGRVTGSTAMNQTSSRSHAVFTIIISKESRTDKNLATTSKFHLVDLAGSERIKKTMAIGERLKEGVKNNQGLLALGMVIAALGDGTRGAHINYRDSKLTRLLQDSLGGNSLTLMVACVSPADFNIDETLSTLRYADRARRIRNKPIINQDTKCAEIVRLNNLVNELRLQIIGKVPTVSEQNDEQEEFDKEKYLELQKKYKLVTKNLGNMLIENTNLCEKALLAEAAKDKIEQKLKELVEQCNQTIKTHNMSETFVVDYFKEFKLKLEDLQLVNLKTDAELIDHEIKLFYNNKESNGDKVEDDAVLEEENKRAMGQVALNQDLQDLNRDMAIKASVVQAILADNNHPTTSKNNNDQREKEDKIEQLEKERDILPQQLKHSMTQNQSFEKHHTEVSSLGIEISELNKEYHQQYNIISMSEKNKTKIVALNAELQTMKTTKVKIIKQMREDSEKFRKWKADTERAMVKTKDEDLRKIRKQAADMAKMESLHAKQQKVLKRKMEQAVAVNKRLKEALDRQKLAQMHRSVKGTTKANVVQQYIDQELEVHLSIVDAEKSLEELLEYRAMLMAQIGCLHNSSDNPETKKKIRELEDDLTLRKAQISDLQQKIITGDQENKSLIQWDYIQSILEAKVALKYLFELLVESKRELQNQSDNGFQARYEEIKEAHDRLSVVFDNDKSEFESQVAAEKKRTEEKLMALVALQRGVVCREDRNEACKQLQNVIQTQQERLEQVEEDNKKLVKELEQLRSSSAPLGMRTDTYDEEILDKDRMETPLMRRIQAHRSRLSMTLSEASCSHDPCHTVNISRAPKRSSDRGRYAAPSPLKKKKLFSLFEENNDGST